MMLNDLDTSVFGEENELGDDSPSFISKHHLHNCTISLGLLPQSQHHL